LACTSCIIFVAQGPALGMLARYLFFSSSVVAAMIFCVFARTEFSYSSMRPRIWAASGETGSCATYRNQQKQKHGQALHGDSGVATT
jgi:hypothetical protein